MSEYIRAKGSTSESNDGKILKEKNFFSDARDIPVAETFFIMAFSFKFDGAKVRRIFDAICQT